MKELHRRCRDDLIERLYLKAISAQACEVSGVAGLREPPHRSFGALVNLTHLPETSGIHITVTCHRASRTPSSMWRRCRLCGWWQKGQRQCEGCSYSSSRAGASARVSPKPTNKSSPDLPTSAVLQDRWCQAKLSAQNPKHMKIVAPAS